MTRPQAKDPVPNPAYDRVRAARTPRNDQMSLFSRPDPDARIVIARRLGTRYAAA